MQIRQQPETGQSAYSKDARLSFYVAASDRDILAKISDIMRGQGYVGADVSGQIRYIIDGRRNLYSTVHRIQTLTQTVLEEEAVLWNPDQDMLRKATEEVLDLYEIPGTLKGYQLLRYMLILGARDETILRPMNKTLYPKTAEHFHINCQQVDRIVRYATRRAGIPEGNASLILRLRDEVVRRYDGLSKEEESIGN